MAARANRLGVKRAEMEAYAATAFADLPAEERLAAIESAYSHVEEHAAETSAATSGKRAGARWTWSPWRPIYPSVSSPARTA